MPARATPSTSTSREPAPTRAPSAPASCSSTRRGHSPSCSAEPSLPQDSTRYFTSFCEVETIMKPRAVLGYTGATVTLVLAILTPFWLSGFFSRGVAALPLHIDEVITGGPVVR